MTPLPRPSSIRPCSALSRSFLLGPFGPAGAPPGQRLRSGSYMAANEAGQASKISSIKVSTLSGEPRYPPDQSVSVGTVFLGGRICCVVAGSGGLVGYGGEGLRRGGGAGRQGL